MIQHSDVPARPGYSALGRPPSTTKTALRASTDGPDYPSVTEKGAFDLTILQFLHRAAERLGWSGRGLHRVLKVARTIADLAGSQRIEPAQIAEAMQWRRALPQARPLTPTLSPSPGARGGRISCPRSLRHPGLSQALYVSGEIFRSAKCREPGLKI